MGSRQRESRVWARIVAILVGLFVFAASSAAFAMTPMEYVKKHTDDVTKLLEEEESAERSRKFSQKAQEIIDFRTLASRALGEHWDKRSEEEQQQFLDLLQELLEANYKRKLEGQKIGEDYTIAYEEAKQREDRAIVRTRVRWGEGDKKQKPVEYKLMNKEDGWIAYDVVIDDISLEETYRESYTEIIEDEGWEALIQKMKDKIEELKSEDAGEGEAQETAEK